MVKFKLLLDHDEGTKKNQGQNKLAKWYAERALFLVGKIEARVRCVGVCVYLCCVHCFWCCSCCCCCYYYLFCCWWKSEKQRQQQQSRGDAQRSLLICLRAFGNCKRNRMWNGAQLLILLDLDGPISAYLLICKNSLGLEPGFWLFSRICIRSPFLLLSLSLSASLSLSLSLSRCA